MNYELVFLQKSVTKDALVSVLLVTYFLFQYFGILVDYPARLQYLCFYQIIHCLQFF